jgi:hypothetical protein
MGYAEENKVFKLILTCKFHGRQKLRWPKNG